LSCAISDKDESNSKAENTFDFILSLLVSIFGFPDKAALYD
jgi:hypothetical protein